MKIVINECLGVFGLSFKAIKRYLELKGKECYFYEKTKSEYAHGYNEWIKSENVDPYDSRPNVSTKDFGEIISEPFDEEYCFFIEDIDRTDSDLIKTSNIDESNVINLDNFQI